ncbi:MAG: NO-inducible flavohemoprotein [Polaromonas sp.]|nr:NO-inducible flavohemoprotein [Polaromonas sp.]
MLTAQQRAIVKSTVPLLETGGEALTTHFYKILLSEHPEVRPFFNEANQITGDQPRALANGVLMYARHIDKLDELGGLVSKIINKHASLQIEPAHYPVVGACLLRGIREVLGAEIATDEVIDAWGAAYAQLADILMGAEEKIHADIAAAPGGWRGSRSFVVARKVVESSEITSFYFVAEDGAPIVSFESGQYVGLRLLVGNQEVRRNYSLSAASDGHTYRISVKRQPGGMASNFLHDKVQVGDLVDLFPPAGDFILSASQKPLVLISGGVGITPTLAMLDTALAAKRPVHFIHFARNHAVHAFRNILGQRQAEHASLKCFYVYDEQPDEKNQQYLPNAVGRVDSDMLQTFLPVSRDIDAYFLGPQPFMRTVREILLGLNIPAAQIKYEFFGPDRPLG